jgi:hypothetical protein
MMKKAELPADRKEALKADFAHNNPREAITGGTGAYSKARGTETSKPGQGNSADLVIRLR